VILRREPEVDDRHDVRGREREAHPRVPRSTRSSSLCPCPSTSKCRTYGRTPQGVGEPRAGGRQHCVEAAHWVISSSLGPSADHRHPLRTPHRRRHDDGRSGVSDRSSFLGNWRRRPDLNRRMEVLRPGERYQGQSARVARSWCFRQTVAG
jgi:hypothetical protein